MSIQTKGLELLKKGWPYLAILVVGVLIGWYVKPSVVRVEEKTVTVEKMIEKKVIDEVLVQAEVERRVKAIESTLEKRIVRVVVTKPDGTKVEKETTDVKTATKETETEDKVKTVTVEKIVTVDRFVDREVIVEKKIEPVLPDWKVGILIGTAPRFDSPVDTPLLLGVEVDRRIAGPFSVSLWGMAGSPVVGGFKITNAALGLGAKMEF